MKRNISGCNLSPLLFALYIVSLCPQLLDTKIGKSAFPYKSPICKFLIQGFHCFPY